MSAYSRLFVLSCLLPLVSFGVTDFAPKDRGYRVQYPQRIQCAGPKRGVMSPIVPKEQDFKDLKAWGANLMRYQMNVGQQNYDNLLAQRLDHLERSLIPWGRKYGIMIAVDLHEPPGGRVNGEIAMYHDAKLAEKFVDFWVKTAARFKGNHDVIYGYDLINEPVQNKQHVDGCDYWTLQKRAAEAIRKVDKETPIILAANNWDLSSGFSHFPALEMDNVIYEVHVYEPHEFTHQGVQKQWPKGVKWPSEQRTMERLDEKLRPVRQFAYNHKAKIYVGEFSAISWGDGAERYIADAIALFEKYGWDWTYHAFREYHGWSVEHVPNGNGFAASTDNARMRVLKMGLKGQVDPKLLTWQRDHRQMRKDIEQAWAKCMENNWSKKTSLVYECHPSKVRPASKFDDGPGFFRWQHGVPGKNHYGEGMGDCALICGTVLSGVVDAYAKAPDAETKAMADKVARGVLNLALLHGYKGFVARGICEEDGRSICSLSSRDQYTHWLHGLYRYVNAGMASDEFKREFTSALVDVAKFMERLCTPERNWNFGMVDGSPDPRGICTMWGPDLHPHEQLRLPMIYGAAWKMTGDGHWKDAYEKYVDEALAKSQGMAIQKETDQMPCYSLLQAQCSFELVRSFETDPKRVALLDKAMLATAKAASDRAKVELSMPRRNFYGMCDDGELSLTMAMVPQGWSREFEDEFLARTFARTPMPLAGMCRVAHLYAAFWRNEVRAK